MKIYRNHKCSAKHRSVRTFLKCAIPHHAWISGKGDIAVIAWCRIPTVTLWTDMTEALRSKRMIDDTACGGRCTRKHDIVKVMLP